MRNIILINLQSAWKSSGTIKPLNLCIVEFQKSYIDIFQIDDLLPGLAESLFLQWIRDNVTHNILDIDNNFNLNNTINKPIKDVIEGIKTIPANHSHNKWSPKTLSTEHIITQQYICPRCNREFRSQLALNGHGKSNKCKKNG